MTPVVKTRIEQIRRDEVPEGYKKGKLGIVPDEWENVTFSTLFTCTSDYTDDLDKYPLYSLTIEDGITPKTERYERSHLVKKEDSYKIVRPNDYAYNPMNLRFGAVARHKGTIPVAVSGYYDIFTTVHESDLPFMDSFLTCGTMITYYNRVSTGSLVEKQRVHFSQFLDFALPLPPVTERAKIAAILTTQDKVIELKEKRLAEKQRQKKYMVQQLLKGRKRLPGFNSVWTSKKLGDVCCYSSKHGYGKADAYVSTENILPDFGGKVLFNLGSKDMGEIDGIIYAPDDILIGNIRPYLKKVWKANKQGVCSPDVLVLHPMTVSPDFLYCLISNDDFFRYVMTGVKGSKMPRGDKNHIMNMNVALPSLEEQCAIADVAHLITRELDLLRQDIKQEKQKKKALMQLLLTGIVRCIDT